MRPKTDENMSDQKLLGWSLPPGVTMDDIDPPERCEHCGERKCACNEPDNKDEDES